MRSDGRKQSQDPATDDPTRSVINHWPDFRRRVRTHQALGISGQEEISAWFYVI